MFSFERKSYALCMVFWLFPLLINTVALPASTISSSTWNGWQYPTCPFNNTWTQVAVRHPPTVSTYGTTADLTWPQPARSFLFGNWHVTYSSRSAYQTFYNFQADCYPVLPTQSLYTPEDQWQQVDLTSFNLPPTGNATADAKVYPVYGLDTPEWNVGSFVFKFRGGGKLSDVTSVWELVAWGYDTNGNGYRVDYETDASVYPGESALIVLSRVPDGPSSETYQAIINTMKAVFVDDQNLSAYVRNTTMLPHDNRRNGQGVIGCDVQCMMND